MNRPSLKKHIVRYLSVAPEIPELAGKEIVILTPMGIIIGMLPPADIDSQVNYDGTKLLCEIAAQLNESYKSEYDITLPLEGDEGYIILTHARCLTNNSVTNIESVLIFYDQIIGITFGNVDM